MSKERKIAVIGLGYVGLPVAVAFAKHAEVVGYDINRDRIASLQNGLDRNQDVDSDELKNKNLTYTTELQKLQTSDFFIVTVPTPIDNAHKPDLRLMHQACEALGKIIKKGDIIVFESTVYPGAVEETCIPILELHSKLKAGKDFGVGYSPERINPGDKEHNFTNVTKIISAYDPVTLDIMEVTYGKIAKILLRASSLKVAEAAKVIENTQRDLNIALMNELAIIFNKMQIDTQEVINCAKTKWNFYPALPGLVGGHCIGVDPYYLTYKAKQLGYRPEVILAGRRINDGMGKYIADQTIKNLILKGIKILGAKIAVLGLTFKEDCRDLRNSKVVDVIRELKSFGAEVYVHDPITDPEEAINEYNIHLTPWEKLSNLDAIVLCVAHTEYKELSSKDFLRKFNQNRLIVDVKSILNKEAFKREEIDVWRM